MTDRQGTSGKTKETQADSAGTQEWSVDGWQSDSDVDPRGLNDTVVRMPKISADGPPPSLPTPPSVHSEADAPVSDAAESDSPVSEPLEPEVLVSDASVSDAPDSDALDSDASVSGGSVSGVPAVEAPAFERSPSESSEAAVSEAPVSVAPVSVAASAASGVPASASAPAPWATAPAVAASVPGPHAGPVFAPSVPGAPGAGEATTALPHAPGSAAKSEPANRTGLRRTRKARLRLSRVDPWSVMKTSFLFSIAFGIMSWVAVWVLWTVIVRSGLFEAVNSAILNIVSNPTSTETWRIEDYINTNKVLGITALVAVINVVITTALGTLAAFLYNLSANILGGLELTLAED